MLGLNGFIKKYLSEYLNPRIVFLMDLVLSLISSALVFFILGAVTNNGYGSWQFALIWFGSSIASTVVAMLFFKTFRIIIRYSALKDYARFAGAGLMKCLMMTFTIVIFNRLGRGSVMALSADLLITLIMFLGVRMVLVVIYDVFREKAKDMKERTRVLIYGTGDKSIAAYNRLKNSYHYRIVGFIAEDNQTTNVTLHDMKVYSGEDRHILKEAIDDVGIGAILFPTEQVANSQRDDLIPFCGKNGLKPLIVPSVEEVVDGKIMKSKIREVRIEDLLGRDEIKINLDAIKANFSGKVVMVTGAAGSIGSELCRQLAGMGVGKLVLFDNAETPMHNIQLEMEERFPNLSFVPVIGDVRLKPRLDFAFREHHPQVVFHAAAYKHVPLMENNPCEAVLVNVYGTKNVADKCIEYGVEKMVMISTDKAVNPTNIMGCTKRLAEIYVQSLGLAIEKGDVKGTTRFVTTRFGNVLGSNGSVIPRFRAQIEKGGPLTVTHPEITRFFMTIPEACRLVMEAATMSTGNQIYVFDMGESVKIETLAKRMIELAGLKLGKDIEIEYTGLRPGEKLYEEVLSNKENTEPTSHDRIRVAKVRSYDYDDAVEAVNELEKLSRAVNIPDMVILMKKIVPEFISKNSKFEEYDKR